MKTKQIATFQIQDMLPIGLTIIVLGIGLGYGLSVMGEVSEDMAECSNDSFIFNQNTSNCVNTTDETHFYHVSLYMNNNGATFNATQDAIEGTAKLPEKLPLIVTVIVAAIIIGILVRYLMVRY